MEVSKKTIAKALIANHFPDNQYNVMTIEDGLQWEDREDYDTVQDAIKATIEDYESQLKRN